MGLPCTIRCVIELMASFACWSLPPCPGAVVIPATGLAPGDAFGLASGVLPEEGDAAGVAPGWPVATLRSAPRLTAATSSAPTRRIPTVGRKEPIWRGDGDVLIDCIPPQR